MDRGTFARPTIVGILNVTEDSFSDGGRFLDTQAAIDHAAWLAENGADIIEIGPASSNPDAATVSADEEIERIDRVLKPIRQLGIPISVDSYLAETQRYAISAGVDIINDVTGFADDSMHAELAASPCQLIAMHSLRAQGRATREVADTPTDANSVADALERRIRALTEAGVARDRIVADPGMGYFLSSTAEDSYRVLANLPTLQERLDVPVMVSVSRKSFLRNVVGRGVDDAGYATLAAETYAATSGVDYIRTHDVRALGDGLTVLEAIRDSQQDPTAQGKGAGDR